MDDTEIEKLLCPCGGLLWTNDNSHEKMLTF